MVQSSTGLCSEAAWPSWSLAENLVKGEAIKLAVWNDHFAPAEWETVRPEGCPERRGRTRVRRESTGGFKRILGVRSHRIW